MDESSRLFPGQRWIVRTSAIVLPLLTCAVLSLVRDEVTPASSVLMLVVWVIAAAATGDRVAAVLAAVSSVVWFDYFLTVPYHRLTISDSDDVETAILLVLISLLVSEIALWGYRQRGESAQRSGYLAGVVAAARRMAEGDVPSDATVAAVSRSIAEVLDADTCQFVNGPVHDRRIYVLDHDGHLTRDGKVVDVDRGGLPTDDYIAVPVQRNAETLGHFLVSAASHVAHPSREQRQVAALLADQVALAVG